MAVGNRISLRRGTAGQQRKQLAIFDHGHALRWRAFVVDFVAADQGFSECCTRGWIVGEGQHIGCHTQADFLGERAAKLFSVLRTQAFRQRGAAKMRCERLAYEANRAFTFEQHRTNVAANQRSLGQIVQQVADLFGFVFEFLI